MKSIRTRYAARKPAPCSNSAGSPPSSRPINGSFANRPNGCLPYQDDAKGKFIGVAKRASPVVLEELSHSLASATIAAHPRTYKLLHSGRRKLARKVIEEACEVTVEAVKRDLDGVVRESADLLYHLVVLWFQMNIAPDAVWQEMQRRADTLGIAEKLPKLSDPNDPYADYGQADE